MELLALPTKEENNMCGSTCPKDCKYLKEMSVFDSVFAECLSYKTLLRADSQRGWFRAERCLGKEEVK